MHTMTLMDRSDYFKGLLLLIRKDAKVTSPEVVLLRHIGKILGFEAGFCQTAIAEILENRHIIDSPPVFSCPEVARCYLLDGITLGYCDHEILPSESQWLEKTARRHNLDYNAILHEWHSRFRDLRPIPLQAELLAVVASFSSN